MKTIVRKRLVGNIPVLEVVAEKLRGNKLPLIIYYHGWQINKTLMLTQARKLAAEGLRVVLPDAPNHGERAREISPIPSLTFWNSIHGNLFEFDYIVAYFQSRDLADERLAVGGISMGGMTTTALLTQHPEIQAAACVMGTPSLIHYRDRIMGHAQTLNFHLPKDYRALTQWLELYDLSLNPERLANRPLFIWHGDEDERVPIEPVQAFVADNPAANIEAHFTKTGHLVDIATMDLVTDFFCRFFQGKLI